MWLARAQTVVIDERGHAHLGENAFDVVLCRGKDPNTFLTVPLERGAVPSVESFDSLSAPPRIAFGGPYVGLLARIDGEGRRRDPGDFEPAPYKTMGAKQVLLDELRAREGWLGYMTNRCAPTIVEQVVSHETMRRRFL